MLLGETKATWDNFSQSRQMDGVSILSDVSVYIDPLHTSFGAWGGVVVKALRY
jgi:hypothetical protein